MPARQFSADEIDEFYLASGRGDMETVGRLLDAGLDVNSATRREFHRTALMAAAMTGRADTAQLLLTRSAALDVRDRELGCTASILAAQQRSSAVLRLLAEAGARLNVFNSAGYSALFWCVENGDAESAELLLDAGADPDRRNRDGLAALHLCAAFGRLGIARLLLETGANVNPVSSELHGRHTPLTLAAVKGNIELLTLLASHGADLDHSAEEGTALALARGQPDVFACVERLIKCRHMQERRRSSAATALAASQRLPVVRVTRKTPRQLPGRPQSALPSNLYPTSSRPRGICLLASNARFTHELDYPALPGTDERAAVLTEALSDLRLLIRPAVGLSGADLLSRAQRLAACDHSAADLLVCAVLTYGVGSGIVGSDGKLVDIVQLLNCFSPVNCPSLAGKPKLFLSILATAPRARNPPPTCPDPGQPDCLLASVVVAGGSGDCARLTEFLRRLRRSLETEVEHADFERIFLSVGERLQAECEGQEQQELLLEVRHSLVKQLIFK